MSTKHVIRDMQEQHRNDKTDIGSQRVRRFGHLMRMPSEEPANRGYTSNTSTEWKGRGRTRRRLSDSVADKLQAHGSSLLQPLRLAASRRLHPQPPPRDAHPPVSVLFYFRHRTLHINCIDAQVLPTKYNILLGLFSVLHGLCYTKMLENSFEAALVSCFVRWIHLKSPSKD